jgi:hypothetical protein
MFVHEELMMPADFIGTAAPTPKAAAVEAEDELPQIDETTVESFSQEVAHLDVPAMLSTDSD